MPPVNTQVCCVCSKSFVDGKTFTLTEEEKLAFPDYETAPDEVSYCASCLRVMSDKISGAQLLKGLYEMRLRQRGVSRARERADVFHNQLLKATVKKLH